MKKLLISTDLDSTLLYEDYSYEQAKPMLAELKARGFPVILNSSKTLAEMREIAAELNTAAPIVSENGGIMQMPDGAVRFVGLAREDILREAHRLRSEGELKFSGFSDWEAEELVKLTGLPLEGAHLAKERLSTEPIIWKDSEEHFSAFQEKLLKRGIRALRGGQFVHLMGAHDKAEGMKEALAYYQELEPEAEWVTVALGDSANDLKMLEVADWAVVIPREKGVRIQPERSDSNKTIIANHLAAEGWAASLRQILSSF